MRVWKFFKRRTKVLQETYHANTHLGMEGTGKDYNEPIIGGVKAHCPNKYPSIFEGSIPTDPEIEEIEMETAATYHATAAQTNSIKRRTSLFISAAIS